MRFVPRPTSCPPCRPFSRETSRVLLDASRHSKRQREIARREAEVPLAECHLPIKNHQTQTEARKSISANRRAQNRMQSREAAASRRVVDRSQESRRAKCGCHGLNGSEGTTKRRFRCGQAAASSAELFGRNGRLLVRNVVGTSSLGDMPIEWTNSRPAGRTRVSGNEHEESELLFSSSSSLSPPPPPPNLKNQVNQRFVRPLQTTASLASVRQRPRTRHRPAWSNMLAAGLVLGLLSVTCYALATSHEHQQLASHRTRPLAAEQAQAQQSSSRTSAAGATSKPKVHFHHLSSTSKLQASEDDAQATSRLANEVVRRETKLQGALRLRRAAQQQQRPKMSASTTTQNNRQQRPNEPPSSRDEWQPVANAANASPTSTPTAGGIGGGRIAGANIKNVTAQNGQSATLHCLVEPDASGQTAPVSWFRGTSELQLISFESTVMIQDTRFVVRRGQSRENDWALHISDLNKSTDSGLYQCQTSDESSPQLQAYQLNIVEPQATILGSPDLAVKVGAPINLTCVIAHSPDQLQFVFWYRDQRMINYDLEQERRGKIVMSKSGQKQDAIASNLQIFRSHPSDSANYTCAPSGARSTSIYVHVLEASDKRLIMFQNDDNQQRELFAASSQQTNSALSSQLVRLSRGRAYAMLVGLFILATWFQLVAQVQTCISLGLLAIIGLFLSHTTRHRRAGGTSPAPSDKDDGKRRKQSAGAHCDHEHKFKLLDESASCAPSECRSAAAAAAKSELSGVRDASNVGDHSEGRDEDPLLSGANSALHLLRALTRRSESASSLADEPLRLGTTRLAPAPIGQRKSAHCCEPQTPSGRQCADCGAETRTTSETRRLGRKARPASPQTSPSGSTGSSTSTGYNSDSRQVACACVNLLPSAGEPDQRPDEDQAEDELEMIELLRNRPSAMRLIMEQLRADGINQLGGAGGPAKSASATCARRAKNNKQADGRVWRPLEVSSGSLDRPACLDKRRHFFPDLLDGARRSAADEEFQAEPIYSIPARQSSSSSDSLERAQPTGDSPSAPSSPAGPNDRPPSDRGATKPPEARNS